MTGRVLPAGCQAVGRYETHERRADDRRRPFGQRTVYNDDDGRKDEQGLFPQRSQSPQYLYGCQQQRNVRPRYGQDMDQSGNTETLQQGRRQIIIVTAKKETAQDIGIVPVQDGLVHMGQILSLIHI